MPGDDGPGAAVQQWPDLALGLGDGFRTRKDAENYGRDQEAAIRNNTYIDPRAGRITLTEWVNKWFPALDLEPNTLSTYRYTIEVHILPAFGDRPLRSLELEPEAIASGRSRLLPVATLGAPPARRGPRSPRSSPTRFPGTSSRTRRPASVARALLSRPSQRRIDPHGGCATLP